MSTAAACLEVGPVPTEIKGFPRQPFLPKRLLHRLWGVLSSGMSSLSPHWALGPLLSLGHQPHCLRVPLVPSSLQTQVTSTLVHPINKNTGDLVKSWLLYSPSGSSANSPSPPHSSAFQGAQPLLGHCLCVVFFSQGKDAHSPPFKWLAGAPERERPQITNSCPAVTCPLYHTVMPCSSLPRAGCCVADTPEWERVTGVAERGWFRGLGERQWRPRPDRRGWVGVA